MDAIPILSATQARWDTPKQGLPPIQPFKVDKSLLRLNQGIWLYIFFLIFEGAFRKWFLPGLAAPLLIIRDPIALWLIAYAWSQRKLQFNLYLSGILVVGFIGIVSAVLVGHGNLTVALFGARILLLHFPLIFVIGNCFSREDVIQVGRVMLWITIPMTILIALQFYSPQSAWVNLGVAGDTAGAGFAGALGYFRPPGTFSFTNGTTLFFSLAACFVLYFCLNPKQINKFVLVGATIGVLASIPLSISRALFFQVILSALFLIFASSRNSKLIGKILLAATFLVIVLAALSQVSTFQTAVEAFTDRFGNANEAEGGLEGVFLDRFLGGMVSAVSGSSELPFFGYGIGMGTNVGAQLLTGDRVFLIAEGEWGRVIGELGALLGLLVILVRLGLTSKIAIACFRKLKQGDILPWLLFSFGGLLLAQGGWAQPTSLGFCTLLGGLMFASLRSGIPLKPTNKAA